MAVRWLVGWYVAFGVITLHNVINHTFMWVAFLLPPRKHVVSTSPL